MIFHFFSIPPIVLQQPPSTCFLTLAVATTKTKHQMQRTLLLNVVITESTPILKLLTREDQTLLIRGNPLLVLNFGFDIVNGVGGFDIEGDCFAGESFDEDLVNSE